MSEPMWMARLGIAVAAFALTACHEANSVVPGSPPGSEPPPPAVVAKSLAEFADQIQDAGLALAELPLAVRAGAQTRSCPASFDLGDGVTGSCSVDQEGPISHITASGGGVIRPSDWWIRVSDVQGDSFRIFADRYRSATTWGAYGEANMGIQGTVRADDSGNVLGFDVELFSNGHPWLASNDVLTLAGAGGLLATIQRSSGAGTIRNAMINSFASISVVGGCTTIDFADPTIDDRNYCLW